MKPLAYITGTGITNFGELYDFSLADLFLESATKAVKSAGLQFSDIDLVVVASMTANDLHEQYHLSSWLTQLLNTNCEILSVDAACSGGASTIGVAINYLQANNNLQNVLVIGAEKLTDHSSERVASSMMRAASVEEEGAAGLTFPALGALIASRYFHEYPKVDPKVLGKIAVKNHEFGQSNPIAHMKKPLSMDVYLNSPWVAEPLRLFDCAPISDGGAAAVLSRHPKKNKSTCIYGFSQTQDIISLHKRKTITSMKATKIGMSNILKQTKVRLSEIEVFEIHDAFTILELIALEDLGFTKAGEGFSVYDQDNNLISDLQINPSGGLKACGHPVAATGIRQIIELHDQLLNQADDRQVTINSQAPRLGLAQNLGGIAGTCCLTLMGKLDL